MRVYDNGKQVPMGKVTWEMLCRPSTYVNWDEDTDVEWSDEVHIARSEALNHIINFTGRRKELCLKLYSE